ncbi:MAG: archease [Caldimicrobium sp.]
MEREFETFEHGADIGIRGYGETPEEALSNVLKALASLLVETPQFLQSAPIFKYPIEVEAEFLDELLIIFINKVLSISSLEGVLLYEFKGKLKEDKKYFLQGEVAGVPFEPEKYGYGVEVKGATFTLAKFEKEKGNYIAQCVVDV